MRNLTSCLNFRVTRVFIIFVSPKKIRYLIKCMPIHSENFSIEMPNIPVFEQKTRNFVLFTHGFHEKYVAFQFNESPDLTSSTASFIPISKPSQNR